MYVYLIFLFTSTYYAPFALHIIINLENTKNIGNAIFKATVA